MVRVCYFFFLSKFIELLDTVFFILKKNFRQISVLHVLHHGIMPISWWFGIRFVPGGFGTFHSCLNSFIHFLMYLYYGLAALGPAYQKYLFWKKWMTSMQMVRKERDPSAFEQLVMMIVSRCSISDSIRLGNDSYLTIILHGMQLSDSLCLLDLCLCHHVSSLLR